MPVQDNEKVKTIDNSEKINPDYFTSLKKSDWVINVEPEKVFAKKIMTELENRNVPFSAVIRKNDTAAITVSKKDLPYFNAAKAAAKESCVKEFRNSNRNIKHENFKLPEKNPAFFSRNELKREASDVKKYKSEPVKNKGKDHTL